MHDARCIYELQWNTVVFCIRQNQFNFHKLERKRDRTLPEKHHEIRIQCVFVDVNDFWHEWPRATQPIRTTITSTTTTTTNNNNKISTECVYEQLQFSKQ